MGRPRTTVEQFWAKGTPEPTTGCLLWTKKSLTESGYPHLRWDDRNQPASHVALLLDGRPIETGQEALHSCDQPLCFEPRHLRGGTHAENIAERVRRGRCARGPTMHANRNTARGERGGMTKLTNVEVEVMRAVYDAGGATQTQLARWFGVGTSQTHRIVRHQSRS